MRVAVFTGSRSDFWQPLLAQLRRMVDYGYLDGRRLDALGVVGSADELLTFVEGYQHPARKWHEDPLPPATR